MKLILASSSKQRREILNNLGLKYEVVKSLVEESSSNTDPCEYVKDLYQDKEICFSDTTKVYLKEMSDEEIGWYVKNERDLLNRGGYAIQGKASIFLDKVIGDYNTLFGISPSKVYDALKKLGYNISDFELQ